MILDRLENRRSYGSLHAGLHRGLEYLAGFDAATPDGRYPVDGDDVFAMVQSYETAPSSEKRFEAHRRHIDIQYLISGRERVLHLLAGTLEVDTPYDEGRDVEFYRDPAVSSSVLLLPGEFAIFHPHDVHKPGCMAGGRDPVRKVVVKVRVAPVGGDDAPTT
jgi:biofilm protein TabA